MSDVSVLGLVISGLLALGTLAWVGVRLPVRLVVATALLVCGGLVVPALARHGRTQAEAPVIANMALIARQQERFRTDRVLDRDADGRGEYGRLLDLERTRPPLIHENLGAGQEYGYRFYIVLGQTIDQSERTYFAFAVPAHYGVTGRRTVFVDETGVVRIGEAGPTPTITRAAGQHLSPVESGIPF